MAATLRSQLAATLLLLLASAPLMADEPGQVTYPGTADSAPSAAGMAADLLLARPLGLAATLLGTGVFVVSLPLQLFSNDVRDPARRLVAEPFEFTFTRPLGAAPN